MDNLYFLVDWQKDKTQTWSGTCWGLFTSLQKHFKVVDIDAFLEDTVAHRFLRRLKILKPDMGLRGMLSVRKSLTPQLEAKENLTNVFQFAECISTSTNIKSYIYKDLTLSYVKYMHDHLPQIFPLSSYQDCDTRIIESRLQLEKEFLETTPGFFCMGEWLRNFMIEHDNAPANRVFAVGGV